MSIVGEFEKLAPHWYSDSQVYSVTAFDEVEKRLERRLAPDYMWFLMQCNGGRTLDPIPFLRFYCLEELLDQQKKPLPSSVLEIAASHEHAYAYDLSGNQFSCRGRILKYSLGETDRARTVVVAKNLSGLLGIVAVGGIPGPALPQAPRPVREVFEELAKSWRPEPPLLNSSLLLEAEETLGQRLPTDYTWLLEKSNGGFTTDHLSYLRLYSLEEALDRRGTGQPESVFEIFTDDSSGYAFDLSDQPETAAYRIVEYDLGDTDRTNVSVAASNLAEFLALVCLGWIP